MMYFADDNNNLTVQRMTNGTLPDVPFVVLKNKALGKKYELSVLFPHGELSRELHRTWKQKNDPVNILSFPLDEYSGEIIITLETARREAKKYGRTYREHLIALYIHGLAHLKGYDHSDEMDAYEASLHSFLARYLKNK